MTFKHTIQAVDTHAAIPMRVVTGGIPHIPGTSSLERMRWLEANDDGLRKLLLREPRGYAVTMATGPFSWDAPSTWGGAIDRCPCGTGTCAKMAVLHAKGQLAVAGLAVSFRPEKAAPAG